MTMPHLMNCSHSEDGWCLGCVTALWDEYNGPGKREAAKKGEKLTAAINNACKTLPDNAEIIIELSSGYADVELQIDGQFAAFTSSRDSLAESIHDATEHAKDWLSK